MMRCYVTILSGMAPKLLNVVSYILPENRGGNGTEARKRKLVITHLVPTWWTRNGLSRRSSTIICWGSSRSHLVKYFKQHCKLLLNIPGWFVGQWSSFQRRRGKGWTRNPWNEIFLFPTRAVVGRTAIVMFMFPGWDSHQTGRKQAVLGDTWSTTELQYNALREHFFPQK